VRWADGEGCTPLAVTVDHNPLSLRTVSTRTLRACERVHNSPTVVLCGTLGPDAPTSRGSKSKLSQVQGEEQTRLTVVTMLQCIEEMIDLLQVGLTVETLFRLIERRLEPPTPAPGSSRWVV
jgi:hypothetical protein